MSLTGTETLYVLGQDTLGQPAGVKQQTTTQEIADLGGPFVSVKEYGAVGDGITDDTLPISLAISVVGETGGGTVYFPPGTYLVTASISITYNNVLLLGSGASTILCGLPSDTNDAIFSFFGAGGGISTTVVGSSIAKNQRTITLTSAVGFSAGDYISLTSDEYWGGIAGVSGYGTMTRGELNRIRYISGSSVTLEIATQDTYDNSLYPVQVRRLSVSRNAQIKCLNFYGKGDGNSDPVTSPTGVDCSYVDSVNIESCRFENFERYAVYMFQCYNTSVSNCNLVGRDLFDPSNQEASASSQFYGVVVMSCLNSVVDGNLGSFNRRLIDITSSSGSPIGRNASITGNTAISCFNGVGTHQSENISIVGNVCLGGNAGIEVRSHNTVVSGNKVNCTGTGLVVGLAPQTQDYTELDNLRDFSATGNIFDCGGSAVTLSTDFDSLTMTGNTFKFQSTQGVDIYGRRIYNAVFSGNTFTGTGSNIGVNFRNVATDARLVLKNIYMNGNRYNNLSVGISIPGSSKATPASGIYIGGEIFNSVSTAGIRFRPSGTDVAAYYGDAVFVGENLFVTATTTPVEILTTTPAYFSRYPTVLTQIIPSSTLNTQIAAQNSSTILGRQNIAIGQYILNTQPSLGGNVGWICTQAGTTGTLSGVTGTINSASATLTVNSANSITFGTWLQIAGAGPASATLTAQVVSITGTTITLSVAAGTSVVAASVSYLAPTWLKYGLVGSATGWANATGVATRTAYASYAGQTVSALYTQSEAQTTDDAVKAVSQTVVALVNDLTTLGIIGT